MSGKLDGKVAVITGGVSGIGLASVELFIQEGAHVAVGDIQDELGNKLSAKHHDKLLYLHTNVAEDAAIGTLVQSAVDRFGRLDVMFNNAGAAADRSPIIDLTPEGFDQNLGLLTRSVMSGHKYAARQFKKQGSGGSIITTASGAALQGGWGSAGYTIAKHAVIGVMRQATAEFGPFGIRSNVICPGIIMTPIWANSFGIPKERIEEFEEFLAKRLAHIQPVGRVGRPKDIAEAALFLASDSSEFITGVVLPVDGGSYAVVLGTFVADVVQAAKDFLG